MKNKFLKLTNTVYKVLEFFPESDPLKNRAKDKALDIMENLALLGEARRLPDGRCGWATLSDIFSEEKLKAQVLEDIDILLGYLWIGKSQGWLNSANCLIIANEYEKLRREIGPVTETMPEQTQKLPTMEKSSVAAQDKPVLKQETPKEPVKSVLDNTGAVIEITARQSKILEFLVKNEKAQVMDLQKMLPDVTKRTIRRDLDDLLGLGKIIRLGEFNQVFYRIKQ